MEQEKSISDLTYKKIAHANPNDDEISASDSNSNNDINDTTPSISTLTTLPNHRKTLPSFSPKTKYMESD